VTTLHAKTLEDVLMAHHVPVSSLSRDVLQQPITSFAVSADNSPFLIAYYDDDGSGTLPPSLHVLRYNGGNGDLRSADLHGTDMELPGNGLGEIMQRVSSTCMGSVMSISESDGIVAINTHINPSAGCVLVLTSNLQFSAGLWGWAIGRVDGQLIFVESMVYFIPTHSERMDIYDPTRKQLIHLYPSGNDAARRTFSAELRKYLPSAQWCQQTDNSCDPENFSTTIDHVIVDEPQKSFAFDVTMYPEGFGAEAEQAVSPKTVHYLGRLRDGRWHIAPG
jgi:hypothetical protein